MKPFGRIHTSPALVIWLSSFIWMAFIAAPARSQTSIDLQTQSRNINFSDASATIPAKVGTSLPATCRTGEMFFQENAAPGANLYACTGTNIWTLQSRGLDVVSGPAAATANGIARYSGSNGKNVKDSTVIVDDAGKITAPGGFDAGSAGPGQLTIREHSSTPSAPQASKHTMYVGADGIWRSINSSGTIRKYSVDGPLPLPAVGSRGGVEALTCPGTQKVAAIGTNGIPVCASEDQLTVGGQSSTPSLPQASKHTLYVGTDGVWRSVDSAGTIRKYSVDGPLPLPAVGTRGGVEAITCPGTQKVAAIGTNGIPVCASEDQLTVGGQSSTPSLPQASKHTLYVGTDGVWRSVDSAGTVRKYSVDGPLPLPAVGSRGGVEAFTCPGTQKVAAIGTNGIPVCASEDQFTISGQSSTPSLPQASKHTLYVGTDGVWRSIDSAGTVRKYSVDGPLPLPAVGTRGGIEAFTCPGTQKISAIGTNGIPVCAADEQGSSSGSSNGSGAGLDPATTETYYDTFGGGGTSSGTIGNLGWHISGSSFVPEYTAAEAGAPSILRRETSSTANTVTALLLGAGSQSTVHSDDGFAITWRIRPSHADTSVTVRAGLNCGAAAGNPPSDGIYFEKQAADTNWHYVTRASSTSSKTDSGSAVSASWVTLKLRRVNATTIGFSVNGGPEVTSTTNIPSTGCRPFTHIVNASAVLRSLDHDYFYMLVTGLSR